MSRPNEFTLAKNANGEHYEEFCNEDESDKLMDMTKRAFNGTFGGHIPVSGEKYAGRLYSFKNVILMKLTRNRN